MTILQAFVLGIIQGLTEFLPVSSSAHLTLAPWAFGWPDPGLAFDVALHTGTLLALFYFFRKEWVALIGAGFRVLAQRDARTIEERRALYVVIATIPAGIGGLLLQKYAESTFRSPALIASALIVMGVVLYLVDRLVASRRTLDDVRWTDALIVGTAQVCALVPGVSRSGSTITASRALGLDRESAAIFSFLLSGPITMAAALKELPSAVHSMHGDLAPLLVGILASAISGWLAISVLLRYVAKHSYGIFAAYRIVIGIAIFALLAARG